MKSNETREENVGKPGVVGDEVSGCRLSILDTSVESENNSWQAYQSEVDPSDVRHWKHDKQRSFQVPRQVQSFR